MDFDGRDPAAVRAAIRAAEWTGTTAGLAAGRVQVFWACGVTPQAAAAAARPELMITHAPGHMFVTDLRDDEQAVPG